MLEKDIKTTPRVVIDHEAGYDKLCDCSSENYNVVNGYKVTTDTVEDAEHNIWVFGSSVARGTFADDAHTIESALQRKLNEFYHGKNNYNIINASNYSGNEVYNLPDFFNKQPIKSGDICIFMIEVPISLMSEYNEIIDLSPYFARPHNYGEIFVDINHMTGKGYCAVAEKIFEIMQKRNIFDICDNNVSNMKSDILHKATHSNMEILYDNDKKELEAFISGLQQYRLKIGAIVMNCNPFTLGHLYLIEYAAKEVTQLFIFVVEEDASFFSFDNRIMLVKEGTKHLKNVTVLPSGQYMISKKNLQLILIRQNYRMRRLIRL